MALVNLAEYEAKRVKSCRCRCSITITEAHTTSGRADALVDGGIRRGTDIVKALALGARRRARRTPGTVGPRGGR